MLGLKATLTASPIALAALSAAFYVTATFAMKSFSLQSSVLTAGLIIALLGAGVTLEIIALRREQLGILYLLILGLEISLAVVVSMLFLGETYSAREILGLVLIASGVLALAT